MGDDEMGGEPLNGHLALLAGQIEDVCLSKTLRHGAKMFDFGVFEKRHLLIAAYRPNIALK